MTLRAKFSAHLDIDDEELASLYYIAVLAWVGCVADTPEVARWFRDDIAFRGDSYDVELAGLSGLTFMLGHVGAGDPAAVEDDMAAIRRLPDQFAHDRLDAELAQEVERPRRDEAFFDDEEAVAIGDMVRKRGWKRVILVSSASHLARGAAACRKEGVDVLPVGCDFQALDALDRPEHWWVVPRSEGLIRFERWLHEELGGVWYWWRGWI